MALDGATLHLIKKEIENKALDARIDKIHKPSKDEIVIALRGHGENMKLLISACASNARIHFTSQQTENPQTPPMFCLLLRKHLSGGRLTAVRQQGMDRILFLDFEASNDFGDKVTVTLAVEIMGRHSNIILINSENKIIDAIKRVDASMSAVRQVLPGMTYTLPPASGKLSLVSNTPDEIVSAIKQGKPSELSKGIMQTVEGMSPIIAREIAFFAAKGGELRTTDICGESEKRLNFFIKSVSTTLTENSPHPTVVSDGDGKPFDFSFIDINQYGAPTPKREYPDFSSLLDSFYSERDRIERMKQRSHDLLKLLNNLVERTARKLAVQKQELAECADRESLKIKGDLISSNMYRLQKGQGSATLENYYSENAEAIEIELDPALTPQQNAQKYYGEYRKAATAEQKLQELIVAGEQELAYLETVMDELVRTDGESELAEIKDELAQGGYLKIYKGKAKQKVRKAGPLKYKTTSGYTVLVGRNNIANDRLTLKESRKHDIWFHTHNIPGSHTVLVTEGETPDDLALEEAAVIAAYHSKARESAQVPVDYTEIRNIKKPVGAKPGFVIYDVYKTAFVSPTAERVENLEIKK